MTPTRTRILEVIASCQPVSIHEIGHSLNLTAPDVFYHLQLLLKSGDIELAPKGRDQNRRRGRPDKRYRLTRPVQPQSTALLAKTLINLYLSDGTSDEDKHSRLLRIARAIAPSHKKENSFMVRITTLVKYLSEIHYAARWEAHQDGPQVIFDNCPYQELVADCPELCEMDRCLLEDCLGAPVEMRQSFIEPDRSTRRCRFSVLKLN